MDHSTINSWLSSDKKWETGLAVFLAFSNNRSLKKRFQRTGFNRLNAGLLYEEMLKLSRLHSAANRPTPSLLPARRQKAAPASFNESGSGKSAVNVNAKHGPVSASLETTRIKIEFSILPDPLKKLHTKKGILFNEASALHKTLDTSTQEQRAAICEQIVENMQENKLIWDELEYFMVNHKIKGLHPDLNLDVSRIHVKDLPPDKMIRRLTSRRSNISRYKKQVLDNPDDEKGNIRREHRISEWSEEVSTIEKLLSSDVV